MINFLCTIPGSGSHYLRDQLPVQPINHCSSSTYEQAKEADVVFTSYRDPMRVAATWANRETPWQIWDDMWHWWEEMIQLPQTLVFDLTSRYQHGYRFDGVPRRATEDRLGVHKALDEGNMDEFHKHVPREIRCPRISVAN